MKYLSDKYAAIAKAVDKSVAGLIGMRYGNTATVSAQCANSKCYLCRLVCRGLNLLEKDHCIKNQKKELPNESSKL